MFESIRAWQHLLFIRPADGILKEKQVYYIRKYTEIIMAVILVAVLAIILKRFFDFDYDFTWSGSFGVLYGMNYDNRMKRNEHHRTS